METYLWWILHHNSIIVDGEIWDLKSEVGDPKSVHFEVMNGKELLGAPWCWWQFSHENSDKEFLL